MRVIAGAVRGKRLATLTGTQTRPTADRVREALFSILYSTIGSLEGKKVLDLFAGSGAVAIEALSRGAEHAWIVENAQRALAIIEKNLISCRFSGHATVISRDALLALPLLADQGPFDIIFVDPPYHSGIALKMLKTIASGHFLSGQGLLVLEVDAKEELPECCGNLCRSDRRRYGSTMLHMYSHAERDNS